MKLKNLKLFILPLFIALFVAGCSKYDEGANMSLRSAKARLTNDWVEEGDAQTSYTTYADNGDVSSTASGVSVTWGTWAFNDDKTKVVITVGSITTEATIIQLKNKSLKLQDTAGTTTSYTAKE